MADWETPSEPRVKRGAVRSVVGVVIVLVAAATAARVALFSTVGHVGQTQQPSPTQPTFDDTRGPAQTDCAGRPTPDYSEVPEGWSALPAPPEPRSESASVWTGERLLAFGGRTDFGSTSNRSVFAFEPTEATWTCGRTAPFDIVSPHAAWDGDRAYVWGPRRPIAYDPSADSWQELPLPPAAAYHPFTVTWTGNELLVWGGDRRAATSKGVAFDPQAGTWRELREAPVAINQGQAIWTGTELIIYGSQLDGNNRAATPTATGAAYDPRTNIWRQLPPFDLSPQATSIAWTGHVMVAFDYELEAGVYDPRTDRWDPLPDLPLEFSECYPDSATLGDGRVFASYCGQAALFDDAAWTKIATPVNQANSADGTVEQMSGSLIAAGTQVYFVGAGHEGQDDALWSWTATK